MFPFRLHLQNQRAQQAVSNGTEREQRQPAENQKRKHCERKMLKVSNVLNVLESVALFFGVVVN